MTAHTVVAYVAANAVIALVSASFIEPLRLALKEMPHRQVAVWIGTMAAAGALFFWMAR